MIGKGARSFAILLIGLVILGLISSQIGQAGDNIWTTTGS